MKGTDRGMSNHGMASCSLINSSGSFYGAAPGCKVLPVKYGTGVDTYSDILISISTIGLLKLLNKLSPHVNVICFPWKLSDLCSIVIRRINDLATKGGRNSNGVLLVWAAGNDNSRLSTNNAIANLPNVALVGAICSMAYRSHYSNYGHGLTLCAPSNNTSNFSNQDPQRISALSLSSKSMELIYYGGTSAAAVFVRKIICFQLIFKVAGVAGLVISANPKLNATQVLKILACSAFTDLNSIEYTHDSPKDSGEFRSDEQSLRDDKLWSPWYGNGKVDAKAAVIMALMCASPDYTWADSEKIKISQPSDYLIINKSIDILKSILEKLEFSDVELIKLTSSSTAVKNVKNVDSFLRMIKSPNVYYETEDHRCFAVTNQGVFTFKEPPSEELLSKFEREYGLTDYEKLDEYACIYTLPNNPIITMNSINDSSTAYKMFGLHMAENDRMQMVPLLCEENKLFKPPDVKEDYAGQWYLHSNYTHPLYDTKSSINCDEAWQALGSLGNSDVVIGVVDTGIDLNHPQSQYEGYMYINGARIISSLDPTGKNIIKLLGLIH